MSECKVVSLSGFRKNKEITDLLEFKKDMLQRIQALENTLLSDGRMSDVIQQIESITHLCRT